MGHFVLRHCHFSIFLVDSWLVSKGRDTDAVIVLTQIYPEGFNIDPVLADIKESIGLGFPLYAVGGLETYDDGRRGNSRRATGSRY